MNEVIILILIIAAGFVASGVIASFFTMVTGRTEIVTEPASEVQRLAAVGLTIFTGPSILTLNAIRSRHNTDQPPAYLLVVVAVSIVWSWVLGMGFVGAALLIPSPF